MLRGKCHFRNFSDRFRNPVLLGGLHDLANTPVDGLGDLLLGVPKLSTGMAEVVNLARRFRADVAKPELSDPFGYVDLANLGSLFGRLNARRRSCGWRL
ncbi:hypothetical protein D9M70_409460 [compost metagenome]